MNYLITGATGFIGPWLVKKLVSLGHKCRCLVRTSSNVEQLILSDVEIVRGDITNSRSLNGVADGIDCIFHLATLGHMSNFTVTEEMFDSVNVQGTVNIMNEALRAGVKRIIHCSSTAAMGICSEIPSNENTPCKPHHAYGRSKLKAEQEIKRIVTEKDLPAVIVRFSLVYGPGEPRDMLKLTRLAKKGLIPKIGNKPKLTPLIHISDALNGMLLAAQKGRVGEIYLITNPEPEPFDKIGQIIRDSLRVSRPALYIPEWGALRFATIIEKIFTFLGKNPPVTRKNIESTLADRVFSIEKARKELGFKTEMNVEAGVREMVTWYVKKGWV